MMSKPRLLIVLGVLTTLAVGAAVYVEQGKPGIVGAGDLLMSGLSSRLDEVASIEIRNNEGEFSVHRTSKYWAVADKSNYRAASEQVRTLLIGSAGLVRVEPKTTNHERYASIGLDDPAAAGSNAVTVRLLGSNGSPVAEFRLGSRTPATGEAAEEEYYVLLPGDQQAWLVQGKLPRRFKVEDWLAREIVQLGNARVRQVLLSHRDGNLVMVSKGKDQESHFALAEKPADRELTGQWEIDDIGNLFAHLTFDDVLPSDAVEFGDVETKVLVTTFDGLQIGMEVMREERGSLVRLSASLDEAFRSAPALGESASAAGSTSAAEVTVGGGANSGSGVLLTSATVGEEVERLNALWQGWVYVLPKHVAGYVSKRVPDLLKPKEGNP